jgi:hypothetical protein
MAQITKLFTKGLDTDTAPHLQDKESYSSAMNVHFSLGSLLGVSDGQSGNMSGYNIGGDLGVLEPFAGNTDWTTLFSTLIVQNYDIQGAKCIGYATDDTESISDDTRFIYLFIYTPASTPPNYPYPSSYIIKVAIKYNSTNKVNQISIADSSILLSGAWVLGPNNDNLGFLGTYFVSARVSGEQLIWTDGVNPIRYVDVNKNYFANNPTLEELSLITEPGHVPLTSVRGSDPTKSLAIQRSSVQFTYRIVNEDGFVSVLSPYSITSLAPWEEQILASSYVSNIITINLSKDQKIPSNWRVIDIVVRDLETNVFQVIRSINKYDNTVRTYDFGFGTVSYTDAQLVADHNDPGLPFIYITYQNWDGTNILETLDSAYCAKQFDSIPITSQSLEFASNRLIIANNLEGYDTPSTPCDIPVTLGTPYVVPESQYTCPTSGQTLQPYLFAICEDTGSTPQNWKWAIITRDFTNGINYGYPLDCSYGKFTFNVSGGWPTGPLTTVTSLDIFSALPQTISFDSMIVLDENTNLDFVSGFSYPSSTTVQQARIKAMAEMNEYYDGSATYLGSNQLSFIIPLWQNGVGFNITKVVNNSSYLISGSTKRAFVPGSSYNYGIQFYDSALRKSGVKDIGSFYIPPFNPDTKELYQYVNFDATLSQPSGSIPSWASYYSIAVSKNNKLNSFISFVPSVIKYAYKDSQGVIVFDQYQPLNKLEYYGLAVPLKSITDYGLGYAFKEGDVCELQIGIYGGGQTSFIANIIDQYGGYVIMAIDKALIQNYISFQGKQIEIYYLSGSPTTSYAVTENPSYWFQSEIVATIYTPVTTSSVDYEIAMFGTVTSGTLDPLPITFPGFSAGDMLGDTYIQERNADGGAISCPSMNPYEKTYSNWVQDFGRITPIDRIGQNDLTNQIRWSNIKIPNSLLNGLSSFDALDVTDVDSTAGPITSIILSSKEANLASRLVILCNSGSFIGLISQAQIYSQDQSTAFLSSAPVIGTIQPITGQWGCISPQGVISYKGMVFWADALNREIIQLAGDGATPISQQKAGFLWNQVFRNLPFDESAISAKNIKIGINPYTSEIFVTCPVPNITPTQFPADCGENRLNQYIGDKKVSYVYNYQLNRWVGAYEDNPDQWIRIGDDVFTVGSQYGTNGLKLYKEFDSTPGDFNQLATPSCYISFPISEGYPATIEPLSVILMGQLTTTNTVVYARDSSTSVNNNLTQVTCWNDSNYATREGEKFAPVLRNRLSNNAGQSQVLSITPLVTGSGYLTAPLVTIGPPTLSGGTQATATAVLTSGSVTSYVITNPGTGYTSTPSISVAPPPSGVTATASISVGVAATNTYDYQGIKGDRIRSKTPWVQVTFPAEQQINFQGARFEVKPSSGH